MSAPITEPLEGYIGLTETTPTLPSEAYFDPAIYKLELERIWYRNWIYVAREAELDGPRSFKVITLGDQEILLLRDTKGALQAFYNTCRHRGAQLCQEKQGKLKGKRIVCPYHAWSYGLDGELLSTSSLLLPEDFQMADYPLYRIALTTWAGSIFINLSGEDGLSLAESFERNSERVENWHIGSLKVGHSETIMLDCNWKVFWENFNECLHCPGVHPSLSALVPIYGQGIMGQKEDPRWSERDLSDPRHAGGLKTGAQTWSEDGAAHARIFPDLSEEELARGYTFATCLPSIYVVGHVDHVRVVRMRPIAPERTELHVDWLFLPEALDDLAFDPEPILTFTKRVIQEDGAICEINQKGFKSKAHREGVLMPEEYLLKRFHEWVKKQVAAQ